jgi:hypothetical protein
MTGRVIVGLLWLAIAIIVVGAWNAGVMHADAAALSTARMPLTAPHISMTEPQEYGPADELEGRDAGFDLYGNQIEKAVTDYRIDVRGELYERHAPETEIPRLGAPSL